MILIGIVIALAAAVRSTWSPCGQSMLSQLTPVAEAGRGQRFGRTASWFVAGAFLGGLTLGGLMAAGALLFARADVGLTHALALAALGAAAAGAIDAHVFGFGPPFLRRQVNEDWLTTYRPWVYGGGFGWQIGAGVTTYVMTAAVPLLILVGVLSGRWPVALALGTGFGLARGLAVLLGLPLRSRAALLAFHRRFATWAKPVRQGVIGVELAVAVVGAWIAMPAPVAVVVTAAAISIFGFTRARAPRARDNRLGAASVPLALEQ
jgi:hypothetical protein